MADSNHTSGAAVVTVIIFFTCLSCVVAALRLYTRYFVVKSAGPDDGFIVGAVVGSIAVTVTMCEQVRNGMGRHWGSLSDEEKTWSSTWFWASVWIYYMSLCLVKVSILMQYLRVFPSKKFRIATFTLMAVVVIYSVCTMFSAIFMCTPIQRFWDRRIEGACLDETAVWFSNTILNIVTDIATTVLPLPVLRTLQLPKRQKILLMLVFGLGFLTCLVSILRLHSLYIVSRTDDLSWDNPMPAIWSSTELNVAILCSCLPTLKGLITRIWPKLLSTGYTNQRSGEISHNLGPVSSSGNHRRGAQQEWQQELKSPHAQFERQVYINSPPAQQRPTFLESGSERSVPAANRIYVNTDTKTQSVVNLPDGESDTTPTLARGEDMRYMMRDPTYKV